MHPPKVDVPLHTVAGDPADAARRLADAGVDGAFTFEGPEDVIVPIARAAGVAPIDLYTNIAVSFPRSPTHLAHTAWDLQRLSGGRFALGVGSQVRAHVERRYGAAFDHPARRMADQVRAIHAIFDAWQHGVPLDHRGEFWTLDLMPPLLRPAPLDVDRPPIWVAAVGPLMTAVAVEVADGVILHPFSSAAFFAEHSTPAIEVALLRRDPERAPLTVVAGVITAAGSTDDEQAAALEGARGLIGFYGSTPAYRGVLEAEGAGELQPALRELTRNGRWDELAHLVPDDLVRRIAVCGTPKEVAGQIRARYGDAVDRVALTFPYAVELDTVAALTGAIG